MTLFKISLITLAGLTALGAFAGHHLGYRWNKTKSYPSGVYRFVVAGPETIQNGDLVLACPEDNERQKEARTRGYLPYGLGCPGGYAPLIKKAIALPGDSVVVSQDHIRVNGEAIKNTSRLDTDSQGRPMPALPDSAEVKDGQVWLVSDYNARSWDSRYFGAMPLNSIQGRVYPIWLFGANNKTKI